MKKNERSGIPCGGLRLLFLTCALGVMLSAPGTGLGAGDLTLLSLEELMDVEVTSAAKKPQKFSNATAAIFVITHEDIRRSGVTSIPEALRLAPGVQVARIDKSKWAISIRGFNNLYSDKLLVLIDGRSVYNTFFSGVFWDVQDTMIEDIDRIEVIRGPGATLWGANAVNGVINIITKHTEETQGGLVTAGAGTEELGYTSLRYGGRLKDSGTYRIYGKYFKRDESVFPKGDDAWDQWDSWRAGFRCDLDPSDRSAWTLQGDIYSGESGSRVTKATSNPPYTQPIDDEWDVSGCNLLTRFTHSLSDRSELSLQAYYDHTERNLFLGQVDRNTFDFDVQHRFPLAEGNDLIWGLGYRRISHNLTITRTEIVSMSEPDLTMDLFSGFVQDEVTLIPDLVKLVLGSKFEHNHFTGLEIQPNARLLWTPDTRHTLWLAASRAVRTPSRANREVDSLLQYIPAQPPASFFDTIVLFRGSKDFDSEKLLSLELGYRTKPLDTLSCDISLFYNVYDDLAITTMGSPILVPPTMTIPMVQTNGLKGKTYGGEFVADWHALDWWRFQLGYAFLKMDLNPDGISNDEGESPKHQFSLRSMTDLPFDLELDLCLRHVQQLSELDVPRYTTLDVRLGWRPRENLEVALVGQNLFDPQHPEFVDEVFNIDYTEVERSVTLAATWKF